jgi:DNA-binding PadR family transcriptional regulator
MTRATGADLFTALRHGRTTMRRGLMRHVVLAMLSDAPMHGYQLMQDLEERTHGRWRPSAGSIYPTLQQLEDEGLVQGEELDGRRTYRLTDEGRKVVKDSPLTKHPFLGKRRGRGGPDLRPLAVQLVAAAIQVRRVGTPEAQERAREILVDTRKRMYQLLADDDGAASADPSAPVAQA